MSRKPELKTYYALNIPFHYESISRCETVSYCAFSLHSNMNLHRILHLFLHPFSVLFTVHIACHVNVATISQRLNSFNATYSYPDTYNVVFMSHIVAPEGSLPTLCHTSITSTPCTRFTILRTAKLFSSMLSQISPGIGKLVESRDPRINQYQIFNAKVMLQKITLIIVFALSRLNIEKLPCAFSSLENQNQSTQISAVNLYSSLLSVRAFLIFRSCLIAIEWGSKK